MYYRPVMKGKFTQGNPDGVMLNVVVPHRVREKFKGMTRAAKMTQADLMIEMVDNYSKRKKFQGGE